MAIQLTQDILDYRLFIFSEGISEAVDRSQPLLDVCRFSDGEVDLREDFARDVEKIGVSFVRRDGSRVRSVKEREEGALRGGIDSHFRKGAGGRDEGRRGYRKKRGRIGSQAKDSGGSSEPRGHDCSPQTAHGTIEGIQIDEMDLGAEYSQL